jgi:hypothetical protein
MKPTEATLCCIITDGHKALIATDSAGEKALSRIEQGELIGVTIHPVKSQRSIQQLRLYWAACNVTAANIEDENWNTPERVHYNCKIIADNVKDRYRVKTKDGQEFDVVIPGSVSFAECEHLEACGYFTRAFEIMAKKLNTTVDELLSAVQKENNQ